MEAANKVKITCSLCHVRKPLATSHSGQLDFKISQHIENLEKRGLKL